MNDKVGIDILKVILEIKYIEYFKSLMKCRVATVMRILTNSNIVLLYYFFSMALKRKYNRIEEGIGMARMALKFVKLFWKL